MTSRPRKAGTRAGLGVVLAVIVAGAGGCGSAADRAATGELLRLQRSVYNEASLDFRRGHDPVVLARWATNDSGEVRPGDGQQFTDRVEALSWSSEDGMDGVVELRLTVTTPGFQATSFGQTSYGPGRAQRCVRFHVGAATDSVTTVDCENRPAALVPPAPPAPKPLDQSPLRRAMGKDTLAAAEQAARHAYRGLTVESDQVDGSWVVVVTREAPGLECLGGTRSPTRKIEVTSVDPRPGEADCDPYTFIRGTR